MIFCFLKMSWGLYAATLADMETRVFLITLLNNNKMKIYFLIEIALLLAACLTAIIVTVKNVRLRKKVADQNRSVKNMTEIIYDDMLKRVSLQNERNRLALEHGNLKDTLLTITAKLPERKEKETDAHYHQRCRQTVANKCAKYVYVSDKLISITILR